MVGRDSAIVEIYSALAPVASLKFKSCTRSKCPICQEDTEEYCELCFFIFFFLFIVNFSNLLLCKITGESCGGGEFGTNPPLAN